MSHTFNPSILRAYDIRGIYEETLHLKDAYALGRTFATYLNKSGSTVAVGRDGRISSPDLEEQLIKGLVDGGINVKSIGLGPTPMLYFAQKYLNTDAGIMISGSHNPSNHNGFKICMKSGPFFGHDIQELGKLASKGNWIESNGSVDIIEIIDTYIDYILEDFKIHYPENEDLTIAWDPGNGAAGDVVTRLAMKLPGTHIIINDDIDGTFPNHHPDPSVEKNLEQLKEVVLDEKCDFGFAFDGDGDRIGAIDSKGRVLWGDMLVTLFAEEVAKKHPGSKIIMDIKSSKVLTDKVDKMGVKSCLYRTGHSYIKEYMKEINSPLAGELSGHIFFADRYYGFDDAIYAALRFIGRFSDGSEKPSQWLDNLPKIFASPELSFESTSTEKFKIIKDISKKLRDEKADFLDIDGVRVNTEHGWWLLRASNTQDILVGRMESTSEEGLNKVKENMETYLINYGLKIQ